MIVAEMCRNDVLINLNGNGEKNERIIKGGSYWSHKECCKLGNSYSSNDEDPFLDWI